MIMQASLQGMSMTQFQAILDKAGAYADLVENALADPALPRVAGLIRQIKAMEKPKAPVTAAATTTTTTTTKPPVVGVGLWRTVKPLEIYIWTRQHRVATAAILVGALAGLVLVPVGIGFAVGRAVKR